MDCADYERLLESKQLHSLMADEIVSNVPLPVLGSKIHTPEAISEERPREMFGLYSQTTEKGRVSLKKLNTNPSVFMCTVLKRQHYWEGFP